MGFIKYASFLDSYKHAWQVQQHFGRIMRHYESVEK
jgi:hypothetical protein